MSNYARYITYVLDLACLHGAGRGKININYQQSLLKFRSNDYVSVTMCMSYSDVADFGERRPKQTEWNAVLLLLFQLCEIEILQM